MWGEPDYSAWLRAGCLGAVMYDDEVRGCVASLRLFSRQPQLTVLSLGQIGWGYQPLED